MISITSMRFRLVSSLLLFVLLFSLGGSRSAAAQTPSTGPTDPAEIEAFFDGAMGAAMVANHVPGAVVVVVKDGAVLFAKGFGYADLETNTPVDPATTLFRPGSVSKLFTWTSVMQLVEQGKLDLDTDVNTYLDFTIPATYPEPITLRHLLTHTPGFEDIGEDLFKLNAEDVITLEEYLKKRLPARVYPPGAVGAYSNYGTALAGYIVERVSGVPFTEYVQQNILEPLGMQHATFEQPLPAAISGDMSSGYNYFNGGYVKGGFEYVVGYPAGSMSVSGLDIARFMIAHLQDGQYEGTSILSPSTAQQMHSLLRAPDPRISGMAYGFFQDTFNGQNVISHGGDTLLFHSSLQLLLDQNVGIFISTNGATGVKVVQEVSRAFYNHYYPQEPTALTPTADFRDRAAVYAGSYLISRRNFTSFEKIITQLTPITVTVDADQNVVVSMAGQIDQYVETEPGLLVNRYNPSSRLLLVQSDGQTILETGHPFVFIKAQWYDSITLHGLIFIGGALLFLIAVIAWIASFIGGLARRENRPMLSRLARLAAGFFGLALLAFLFVLIAVVGDINPAYGVPNVFFTTPPIMNATAFLPIVMTILAAAMLVFAVLAWVKRWWTPGGRFFYTLLTLFAAAAVWGMVYWNML